MNTIRRAWRRIYGPVVMGIALLAELAWAGLSGLFEGKPPEDRS
jgi:hypothetical protein